MANKKYLLRPIKQSFMMEDEEKRLVYEAKMLKFKLFTASPFAFINHITNINEEHKIGKTVTSEESGVDGVNVLATKSYFKYDGKNIWDYLHEKGIRIDSNISGKKLGMTYDITFEGKPLATVETSSPKGKSIITTDVFYDVICEEKDLDLVFLVAFAIAKTEQLFYN